MTNIMRKLSSGWHLMRIFRLAIGIGAGFEGVILHDPAIGLLGAFFIYQGLTDTGCCGGAGCLVPPAKKNKEHTEDIKYEEIK